MDQPQSQITSSLPWPISLVRVPPHVARPALRLQASFCSLFSAPPVAAFPAAALPVLPFSAACFFASSVRRETGFLQENTMTEKCRSSLTDIMKQQCSRVASQNWWKNTVIIRSQGPWLTEAQWRLCRQRSWSTLFPLITCHLFGAKP